MKRTVTPELLDSDAGNTCEVASSLADLQRIIRWFGSIRTVTKLIQNVATETGQKQFSLLAVAGASRDLAAAVRKSLSQKGITVDATLLDRNFSHLSGNCTTVDRADL